MLVMGVGMAGVAVDTGGCAGWVCGLGVRVGCAGWVCESAGIRAGRDGVGVSRHGHGRACRCERG